MQYRISIEKRACGLRVNAVWLIAMLKTISYRHATKSTKSTRSSPRNERWRLRSLRRRGNSPPVVDCRPIRPPVAGAKERASREQSGQGKVTYETRPLPEHPHPTVDLLGVRPQLASLSVDDMSGVAVVMPCTDIKTEMTIAHLLARRAGMDCKILVVQDTLRQEPLIGQ